MEHLPVHLANEARLGGPVQFRYMYPIERFLFTLKNYVRNRRYPEGLIAEGYLAEECLNFCNRYLHDVETKLNRPLRNIEGKQGGARSRKGKQIYLDKISWEQAHRYILANSEEVFPFMQKHIEFLRHENGRASERDIAKKHNEQFPSWFKEHVLHLQQTSNVCLSDEVKVLSAQPDMYARRFTSYTINGLKYRTKEKEKCLTTQNSGVLLTAKTNSFSSSKDNRPVSGEVDFYGTLADIIELRYSNEFKFLLFRCDWVDNNSVFKKDEYQCTLVNFKHLLYKQNRPLDEPYILESQAKQVWYVQDPIEKDWQLVMKMFPRDVYDLHGDNYEEETTSSQVEPNYVEQLNETSPIAENNDTSVVPDEDGIFIDPNVDSDDGISDEDDDDDAYVSENYVSSDDEFDNSVSDDEDIADSSSSSSSDDNDRN